MPARYGMLQRGAAAAAAQRGTEEVAQVACLGSDGLLRVEEGDTVFQIAQFTSLQRVSDELALELLALEARSSKDS